MVSGKSNPSAEQQTVFKEGIKNGVVSELVLPEFVIDTLSPEANRLGMTVKGYLVYLLCQQATEVIKKSNLPSGIVPRTETTCSI